MNQHKVDQLAERIINETNAGVSCLTLYLGHKLNLFNSLRREGPITSEELAKKRKYSERYIREWLECMTTNDYIDYDPSKLNSVFQKNTQKYYVIVTLVPIQFLLFIGFQIYH